MRRTPCRIEVTLKLRSNPTRQRFNFKYVIIWLFAATLGAALDLLQPTPRTNPSEL